MPRGVPDPTLTTCAECGARKSYDALRCVGCARAYRRVHPPAPRAFAERVDMSAGPFACWPWLGNRNSDGYGRLRRNGRLVYAHRLALETALGRPLGHGLHACHHCDNPPCVNPLHLFEGTNADNQMDKVRKGRNAMKPALTPRQATLVRVLYQSVPMRVIAPAFPMVSRRTLYRVIAGNPPYQVAA